MDANWQDFAKRFKECKNYYQNKIQDLKGSEKAQVAKEHSLMEKLNQVLEKSVTEKESKIEELRNELGVAQKENEYLRNKNEELSQVRFLIVMHRLWLELFTRFLILWNEYVQACASFSILIALILGDS